MKPKYENIISRKVIDVVIFAVALGVCMLVSNILQAKHVYFSDILIRIMAVVLIVGGLYYWVSTEILYRAFSHDGKRKLLKAMAEAVASRLTLPDDAIALDVGCKDAFLTVTLAKKNPDATIYGIDRWDFGGSSKGQCVKNADIEGVNNVKIESGDAYDMPYAHDSFDGLASMFFYHNYTGVDMEKLYMESMRVLKKGSPFVICDMVTPTRYGSPESFRKKMLDNGIEKFDYVDMVEAGIMSPAEVVLLRMKNAKIIVGIK